MSHRRQPSQPRQESAESEQFELEPSTIHLAFQLYQYYLHNSAYARKQCLTRIIPLVESVIEDWHLPEQYGSEEEHGESQPAKYSTDWVVDQTQFSRACKQFQDETRDYFPPRGELGTAGPKSATRKSSSTSVEYTIPRASKPPPSPPTEVPPMDAQTGSEGAGAGAADESGFTEQQQQWLRQ
jgi:hypothetical protein